MLTISPKNCLATMQQTN